MEPGFTVLTLDPTHSTVVITKSLLAGAAWNSVFLRLIEQVWCSAFWLSLYLPILAEVFVLHLHEMDVVHWLSTSFPEVQF